MTLDDLERQSKEFIDLLAIVGCPSATHISWAKRDKITRDRPRQSAKRNCYKLSCVSWASAQITCFQSMSL